MQTLNNVHQQFAEFFKSETLKPFAFLVSKKLSEGHICLNLSDAANELSESGFDRSQAGGKSIERLKSETFVTVKDGPKQPFVLHNNRLYLQRYFNYETVILKRIKAFVQSEEEQTQTRIAELRANATFTQSLFDDPWFVKSSLPAENIDWQLVAAVSAVLNNFTIITGGPGTGKTTTVAKILSILYRINPNTKVALAAPTGKAAVRMAESLSASAGNTLAPFQTITPGTIHRLLKYIPNSPYFQHNKDNPINYDVVIVDESSMIDVALFAKLLDAIGPETKLILLGDKDQLASVEAGSLFGDLCKTTSIAKVLSRQRADLVNSFIIDKERRITREYIFESRPHLLSEHIVELRRSRRFTSDKGIGKLSKAVITNDVDTLQQYIRDKKDAQITIDVNYDTELFEQFVNGYADYINEPDIKQALQKLNRLRVLCAVREGEQGLYSLNKQIENYLHKKKLINKNAEYYQNRPVIVTKNYYSLGLFNGDVGIIRADENGVVKAWFQDNEGQLRPVFPGYVAESETVFAMTIHKSQGSEYDAVLVVLPNNINVPILTRELLYTAVTRARLKVTVQAGEAVILHAANGVVQRASGIMERFEE